MTDLLILNASVVNEGEIKDADIAIADGRITQIGSGLSHLDAKRILDAKGKTVIPGMIDDQVHFREPGLTQKGDMATESRAAVAGGITSFMEMPNVQPATLTLETLEDKYKRAAGRAMANYAFYLGASNNNLEVIKKLDPAAACGVKVFMGASTGNMLVDRIETLEGIFRESPVLIATHCEDTPLIHANEKRYREKYGDDIPMACHPEIRSEEACYLSSSLAVKLAKQFNSQLHVLHITTAKELALFTAGDINNKNITAEACVHHLFFDQNDYESKGTLIKCNPAIKRSEDRIAILKAVADDVIDIIATDHAPHTWEEKQNSYFKAPAGLPLVQHALQSLFEHYHNGFLSLEKIVEKTSHAVADRYQIKERGYLREGYWADIALIDLAATECVKKDNLYYKCGWSPFEGISFRSRVLSTIVNGELVFDKGSFSEEIAGKRLVFDRA